MKKRIFKALVALAFLASIVAGAVIPSLPVHATGVDTHYWVGGTGSWGDTAHWSHASGGAGGAGVPALGNAVVFNAASASAPFVVTQATSSAACASMDWSAIDDAAEFRFSFYNMQVYGNVVFDALLTVNNDFSTNNYGKLILKGTGAQTITTAGCTLTAVWIELNTTGTYQQQDNILITVPDSNGTAYGFTNTAGTWNSNGFDIEIRTLGDFPSTFVGRGQTYHSLIFDVAANTQAGIGSLLSGANTFTDLTITNAYSDKYAICELDANQIVNPGTFTATGDAAGDRLFIWSDDHDAAPTQRTITAAIVSVAHTDFYNITGAGAGDWNLSSAGEDTIDFGNNSGITFTYPWAPTQTRYWTGLDNGVAGTGYWMCPYDWSTTSGGIGGAPRYLMPLSQSDVVFDANSGFTVGNNVITAYSYRINDLPTLSMFWLSQYFADDIDFTGSGAAAPPVFHGWPNIDFYTYGSITLIAGMTFPEESNNACKWYVADSGTLTTAGVIFDNWDFFLQAGVGTLTLTDDLHIRDNQYYLNQHNWNYVSGSMAGNYSIVFDGTATEIWFDGGGRTYYSVTSEGTGTFYCTGANTFTNLTARATTAAFTTSIKLAANQIVTGVLTLAGYDITHRLQFGSSIYGTQRQITVNTSCAVTNTDISDSAKVGTASPDISAGNNSDMGNNLGWIFTVPATNYWVGNSGSWSEASRWASTSGGVSGTGRVPLIQDTAVFDAYSTTLPGRIITIDITNLPALNTSAATYNPTFSKAGQVDIYGGLNMGTITWSVTTTYMKGFNTASLQTTATTNITTAFHVAKTESVMASCVLSSDFTIIGTVYLDSGVLSLGSYTLTAKVFDASVDTYNRAFNGASGYVVLNDNNAAASTMWNMGAAPARLTIVAGTSTIVFNQSVGTTATRTFAGAGKTYNDFVIMGDVNYQVTISGANNHFGDVLIDRSGTDGRKTLAGGGVTIYVDNFYIPVVGAVPGGPVVTISNINFNKTTGAVVSRNLSITNSNASLGGATFLAGKTIAMGGGSTNGGGNAGWVFSDGVDITVNTYAATGLTLTGAILHGEIMNMGSYTGATVYAYFEYGTTPVYGNTTTEQAKTAIGTFNDTVGSLPSDTLYYFRAAVRYNGYLYAHGTQFTFTTTGAPVITTMAATDITAISANLQALLITNLSSSVYVRFEYGPDTAYGLTTAWQTFTSNTTFTGAIYGLLPENVYHFRGEGIYGAAVWVYGSDLTLTTLAGTGSDVDQTQSRGKDVLPDVSVSDWFIEPDVSGTLLTNPLRPLVTMMSDNTTLTEIQVWRLYALIALVFFTVLAAKAVPNHLFIAGVVAGACVGVAVAETVYPMWALVFTIGCVIGGLVAERTAQL